MPDNNKNRFEVSLLSRQRATDSVVEEVMIDKDTGQVLVKTKSGKIASYDYKVATANAIMTFAQFLRNKGVYTNIYSVEIDRPYPVLVKTAVSILNDSIVITPRSSKVYLMVNCYRASDETEETPYIQTVDFSPALGLNVTGLGDISFDAGQGPIYEIEYPSAENVTISNLVHALNGLIVNNIFIAHV